MMALLDTQLNSLPIILASGTSQCSYSKIRLLFPHSFFLKENTIRAKSLKNELKNVEIYVPTISVESLNFGSSRPNDRLFKQSCGFIVLVSNLFSKSMAERLVCLSN